MDPALASALIALVVSVIGTLVTSALEGRRRIDDAIREQRVVGYQALWAKTKLLPRWPRGAVTRRQILELSEDFRDWYYQGHGMYLSAKSRQIYGNVQQLLVDVGRNREDLLDDPDYDDIRDRISLLRTSLTNDLLSRTRPIVFHRNKDA